MIDLSPTEKAAIVALEQVETALPAIVEKGGGDAHDVTVGVLYARGLRYMIVAFAAGREASARPELQPDQRGADVQTEGGHRVLVSNASIPSDARTWWVVTCTEGDYSARDLDRAVAVRQAYKHSADTVRRRGDVGEAIRG